MGLPDMLPLVVSRVHATKGELTPLTPFHIPIQPEAEDGVLYKALVNHVVKGRHSPCH